MQTQPKSTTSQSSTNKSLLTNKHPNKPEINKHPKQAITKHNKILSKVTKIHKVNKPQAPNNKTKDNPNQTNNKQITIK